MSRPPGRPRTVPAVSHEPPAPDDLDVLEARDPEQLAGEALDDLRMPLTPEVVKALNTMWRDVVQYDDEGSKTVARRIVGRLRRASHRELHPECARITVDVPMLPSKVFVRINERVYFGAVEVWECEARTILELVHRARLVEAARLADNGNGGALDLDSPLAERARAIQRA
jgi:hypothetical protein